jgi:hypothetical protein
VSEGLPTVENAQNGDTYLVAGWWDGAFAYNDPSTRGGGSYVFAEDVPKSQHNGGFVVSPTAPAVSTQSGASASARRDNFLAGTGETDAGGTGCFVKFKGTAVFEDYGCFGDGAQDDTEAVRATLSNHKYVSWASASSVCAVTDTITVPNNRHIMGKGEDCGFSWIGDTPATSPDKTGGTAILRVASADPSTGALSNIKLDQFSVGANSTENMICVYFAYASVQSSASFIAARGVAANSFGFYFSKEWYCSFNNLSVRTDGQPAGSVGLYVSSNVNQFNAVPLANIQVNGADIGLVLDTSDAYQYAHRISGSLEKCNTGVKHIGGFGVRTAHFDNVYFENNHNWDIDWTAPASPSDKTSQILWTSCSFNPTDSKINIEEGQHRFMGCDRINEITIKNARVWMDGNASIISTMLAGSSFEHLTTITAKTHTQRYIPTGEAPNLGGQSSSASLPGGTASEVFPIPEGLVKTDISEGANVRVFITSRRNYEENGFRYWEGFLTLDQQDNWGITSINDNTVTNVFEVSVDSSNGDITVENNLGGTKVANIMWIPF